MDFLTKSYDEMTKEFVLEYISVERMYDQPDKYFASFAARTPHPDFDNDGEDNFAERSLSV